MKLYYTGTILLGGLLLAIAAPGFAQDADPPADADAPAEVDAKELLGDRAEPPKMDDDSPALEQGENAGRLSGTMSESGETRTETVTETHETQVRIGGDPDAPSLTAPPEVGPGWGGTGARRPGWGPPSDRPGAADALAGNWTLMVEGGRSCQVTLTNTPHFGGYAVKTSGCEKDFFLTSRWVGGRDDIQFTDAYDKVNGQLRRAGPSRFEGTRGSDGVRIVLTR